MRRVLAPDLVELDSGKQVALLGVKVVEETSARAVALLEEITQGEQVYFKEDAGVMAADGVVVATGAGGAPKPCYLFLKNKTHVNAHLIQSGLVDVDTSRSYRFQKRFLNRRAKTQ